MSQAPHRVRLSPALTTLLTAVGANSSAAHRALLLLGAHTAGYDLSTCRSDIGRLLGEDLDEPVRQRLASLYELCRTKGGQLDGFRDRHPALTHVMSVTNDLHPAADSAAPALSRLDDPLAAIGLAVNHDARIHRRTPNDHDDHDDGCADAGEGALGRAARVELQLALRPLRGWELRAGWRADGLRRLLRLQQKADHALAPDARRLEAKLAAPAFAAELRLVMLADGRDAAPQADALCRRVADALAVLAERTGPWHQAIVGAGGGRASARTRAGQRARQCLVARAPAQLRLPRLLLPLPVALPALILTVDELVGLWHRPTLALADLVAALPCRHLPAPMAAFLPPFRIRPPHRDSWLALGHALRPDGTPGEVGLTLSDLRYVLHLTAGMGAGKSRLLANLCRQFLASGYCLIDGKGDDAGGLSSFVLQLIPLADEQRVIILDPRDARWPVGLNPLAGLDLQQPGAVDQVVANVFALFARIDPETWGGAQGMRDFLDKSLRLVLASAPHPTLANVKQALLDESYRAVLLERCLNRDVVDYWSVVFPRLGESQKSSRDALLRRFDKLLSADLLRLMITRPTPELDLGRAIATRQIVLMPIPNVALGDLAGVYAMLMLQQFLRAAFARPGDDQTRSDYALIIDELQVLIAEAANADIETALSRLRAFAILLIIAHQALAQLGQVEPLVQINAENRIILKTREPDASSYARQYAHAGLTAGDIINQDPRAHQYAVLRCAGQPAGPFSIAPLPWPLPLDEALPADAGPPWQTVLPAADPQYGRVDPHIAPFMYADLPTDELNHRAEKLAGMPLTPEQLARLCRLDDERVYCGLERLQQRGLVTVEAAWLCQPTPQGRALLTQASGFDWWRQLHLPSELAQLPCTAAVIELIRHGTAAGLASVGVQLLVSPETREPDGYVPAIAGLSLLLDPAATSRQGVPWGYGPVPAHPRLTRVRLGVEALDAELRVSAWLRERGRQYGQGAKEHWMPLWVAPDEARRRELVRRMLRQEPQGVWAATDPQSLAADRVVIAERGRSRETSLFTDRPRSARHE